MSLQLKPVANVGRDLAQQLEFAERDMWRANWLSAPAASVRDLGLQGQDAGDSFAMISTGIPDWFFNRVIGLGMAQPVTEERLQGLISLYRDRQLPVGISLSPFAEPADLAARLEQMGFRNVLDWAKMFRGTEPPPRIDTDLGVRRVEPQHYDIAAAVICEGFGAPEAMQPLFRATLQLSENHTYMMWDGDQPAALGILTVRNGIGHLNTACTLPAFRRRGAQGALMAHRIREGITLGCRLFATETGIIEGQSNSSLQNMVRLGFQLAYARPNFVLQ